METRPKVSILIPVYNTAGYLPKCLASVLNQTLREIEIIVVNDASPDNAGEVLAEYAAKDNRIKIITHEKNGGILAARLSGIAAATGEYLIFLDADDYLDTDTARACYAKAKKTGADMIHFCFDVRVDHKKKPPFAKQVEKRLRPYDGTLEGRRVFEGAFVDNLYRWNIAGKCIAAEVCRNAAAALPPGYYIMAEDFCFYTMLSWFASRYEPLHKKCYYYGLEIGVSSFVHVNFNGFIRNCSIFTALNAVKTFLTAQGVFETYREAFADQERKLIDDLLERWENKLIQYDRIRALKYMFENYSPTALMRSMVSYFGGREGDLAGLIGGNTGLFRRPAGTEVRHIGLYIEKSVSGEDLSTLLLQCASEWTKSGLKVTVLSPDPGFAAQNLITVPVGLIGSSRQERIGRVNFWHTLKERYGIDTVVHGATECPAAVFDALSIKTAGLNYIAVPRTGSHALSSSSLGLFLAKMHTLCAADSLGVLSEEDKQFFEKFQLRCCLLRPDGANRKLPVRIAAGRKKILWLGYPGEADAEVAAAAWAEISKSFPDWKLCMAGYSAGADLRGITTLTDTLGLKDSLEFHTVPADFNSLLKEAALLLSTSGGIAPVYAVPAAESGVPCFNGTGLSPENLAEKLRAFLNGGEVAGTAEEPADQPAGLVLFDLQRPAASGVSADKMLEILNRYRINFEPYALLPEVRGAAFAPLYRELDQLGYRLLPAESSRRDFVFRAFRYLLRRLRGRKGAE